MLCFFLLKFDADNVAATASFDGEKRSVESRLERVAEQLVLSCVSDEEEIASVRDGGKDGLVCRYLRRKTAIPIPFMETILSFLNNHIPLVHFASDNP